MKTAEDFSLVPVGTGPNYTGHSTWESMINTGEAGIRLHAEDGYRISGLSFRNIKGAAVDVQNTGGGWQHVGFIDHVSARHSYYGFMFSNIAEYESVSDCNASNCVFGFLVESGNNTFTNCKASFNSIGVKVYGGQNNAHGVFVGLLSHHNHYNLTCHDVTNGETFVGCQFIGGQSGGDQGTIQMVNSKGISLIGGQVAMCNITVDATSQLFLRGVTLRGQVNVSVSAGGVFDAKDSIVMPGAALTLNGQPWNGNT